MTDATRYGVMGNPIEHSVSPFIHHAFAEQTQQNIQYERILVPLDGLKAAIDTFRQHGGHGVNITVPFKQQAWELADQYTPEAQHAKAANTLVFNENGILADNTDGRGLLHDLQHNLHLTLTNKRIAILGAGGAVRGILGPLLATQPAHCVIVNRTVEKANALAHDFAQYGHVEAAAYDDLQHETFDLLINGTSASLQTQALPLPDSLAIHDACYDMVYGPAALPFLKWGKAHGARCCADGLGMLVEQAALSFQRWRHVQPDTQAVLALLRATM